MQNGALAAHLMAGLFPSHSDKGIKPDFKGARIAGKGHGPCSMGEPIAEAVLSEMGATGPR